MPRKVRDDRLDTRTARLALKPQREPYWRTVQEGRAVGYRRLTGNRAGTWTARHYDATGVRKYKHRALGSADDLLEADGVGTLTWAQVQEAARKWWTQIDRDAGQVVEPITVHEALADYVTD